MSARRQQASNSLIGLNSVLGHSTSHYSNRARANPFVKWPGGKRALVPEIMKLIPDSFGDYWEPFVGGGALFFSLDNRIRNAHLSDLNLELTITYATVKKYPDAVIEALSVHASKHGRKHYLAVRRSEPQDAVELSARFIYLNKTCYNGLYRVNKNGKFNVPIGSHKNPTICDADNLKAAAKVLKKASIRYYSFDRIKPKPGDLVYCDPPYDGGFTAYTDGGFGEDDQRSLRDACLQWAANGAHVIVSNSNTPLIRRLYSRTGGGVTFVCHEVEANRYINCNGNGRGKVTELLVASQ